MNYYELVKAITEKKSFLCVGLDTDFNKIPKCLTESVASASDKTEALLDFNKQIIDATNPYAIAYKLNIAFYEAEGLAGLQAFGETIAYIRQNYPDIFIIADAKRGDIGNTSEKYATAMFDGWNADAVTVSPYMGYDSISPFLTHKGKWTIILGLTSNGGSKDFQQISKQGVPLYESVLTKAARWGTTENTMFVVGATKAEQLQDIRQIVPKHFLLVPGVGKQGGSLQKVAQFGMTKECGLIVNSSRDIIYQDDTEYFALAAERRAREVQKEMAQLLEAYSQLNLNDF